MSKFKIVLFYIISFTWGIIASLVGGIVALALLVTGHKPEMFYGRLHFKIGKDWGGFSMGPFFVTDDSPTLHIKQHEAGHSIQNMLLGPLWPFLVGIPSMIRYWYREIVVRTGKKKYNELPPYDAAWYEGWATRLGEKHFKG